MLFIETPLFTKRVKELVDEESYRLLQLALASTPGMGALIEGTGGLRKVRIATKGQGKRGGARVIYYHFVSASQVAMLYIYAKGEQADLTVEQRKALMTVIQHWRAT
ncbi:type II toxin-antitoxin system RelE/ParE family toxin [Pseudomonas sp. NPDC089554]|uniref:type II toxin-antitoxin system RelE/ParE family toxin n=1 Tax=Pseudomonas sp. NPDC089554 TaxID=3390653 RepID=UPI003D025489